MTKTKYYIFIVLPWAFKINERLIKRTFKVSKLFCDLRKIKKLRIKSKKFNYLNLQKNIFFDFNVRKLLA